MRLVPAFVLSTLVLAAVIAPANAADDDYSTFALYGGMSITPKRIYVRAYEKENAVVLMPDRITASVAFQQDLELYQGSQLQVRFGFVFDPDNTDCYSWALSKDGRLLFGGAYQADGCRMRFERQKQLMAARGLDLSNPLSTEACMVLRPRGSRDIHCGYKGAFLVGEAGSFISPSSLEGISWAMETARLLAESLRVPDPDRAYLRATRTLRIKLLSKEAKSLFLYRPALRHIVMRSGLCAISVQGDDSSFHS
jgi:flavin-dependent dehydrogenase